MSNKKQQQDYFSAKDTFTLVLPDGVSKIIHQKLVEGDRRRYQDETSEEVSVDQDTRKASIALKMGSSRKLLLELAIVDWELAKKGDKGEFVPVPFTVPSLNEFLKNADPAIIDLIEEDVEKHNPWVGTVRFSSVETVDKEIERLQTVKEILEKKEKN